ncbi:MAG: exostosin family protein [Patescibacteria group bacterium]
MTQPSFLRLYVHPAWKRDGLHSPLLYPFWGNPNGDNSLFAKEMFDAHPFDTSLYTITDNIHESDMVFVPYRHNWLLMYDPALLEECASVAKAAGLSLLIDGAGDLEFPNTLENSYILRIGGYRFLPEKNRIIIPAAADDLLERCVGGEFQSRAKREGEKPVVGFAGWARLTMRQTLRTIAKEMPIRIRGILDSRYSAMKKGVLWRAKALAILSRSSRVSLNLRVRSSFSGNTKTASGDLRQLRQDFVDTVLESDYALDVRGDANASTRLFEILSLGRIPVLFDTERNLPFSDEINYDSFCVRVDFRNIGRLAQKIAEFHKNVSPEQFLQMQQEARKTFVEFFRIDAQMKHILPQLQKMGAFNR